MPASWSKVVSVLAGRPYVLALAVIGVVAIGGQVAVHVCLTRLAEGVNAERLFEDQARAGHRLVSAALAGSRNQESRQGIEIAAEKWAAAVSSIKNRSDIERVGSFDEPSRLFYVASLDRIDRHVRAALTQVQAAMVDDDEAALVTATIDLESAVAPLAHLANTVVSTERRIFGLELELLKKIQTAFTALLIGVLVVESILLFEPWHRRRSLYHQEQEAATEELVRRGAELAETKDLLDEMSRLSRIGGWSMDLDTMRPVWSEEVYRIHELEAPNQPELEDAINFYAPEARPLISHAVQLAIDFGESWDLELPFITAKGNRIWVRAIGQPVMRDGTCVRLQGTFQDITEQHTQRLSVQESARRLELAQSAAHFGLWDWDIANSKVFHSDSVVTMLGYEPGEFLMTPEKWRSLIHPADQDAALEHMARYLSGQSNTYSVECRLLCEGGDWLWVRDVGEAVEWSGSGEPTRMIGQHQDIDAQKRVDLALRSIVNLDSSKQEQGILADLCGAIGSALGSHFVAIVRLDEGCESSRAHVVAAHTSVGDFTGASYALRGTPCANTLLDGYCAVARGVQAKYPTDAILTDMNAESYAGVRLDHSDGLPIGILVALNDRDMGDERTVEGLMRLFGARAAAELERLDTEASLRSALHEAEAASVAKSEFLANMSHEIRTPMTAILGYADMLSSDDPEAADPEQFKDRVLTIRRNGEHLLAIINDILDLSKIEAGKLTLEERETDVQSLMHEVVSLMRVKADEKGLKLGCDFSTRMPERVMSDPVRLRQIVMNLVSNAIKFTQTGSVAIRAGYDPESERLKIDVIDTGIGLAPSQRQRVFSAFEQGDSSTARRYGGTGLGLQISRRLAAMLDGEIRVRSQLGVGSTFTLSVTAAAAGRMIQAADLITTPAAPEKQRDETLDGLRVFVAEDGPDNQKLIEWCLKKAGAEVCLFENGLELVEALTMDRGGTRTITPEVRCDLIITDIQMPVLDGYAAVEQLRSAGCTTPIIALTAHAMRGDRERCMAAGCDDYSTKPIDRKDLLSRCLSLTAIRGKRAA